MRVDSTTINWAKARCSDLLSIELNVGLSVERIRNAIRVLRDTADGVNEQPESELLRAYADDLEKIFIELNDRVTSAKEERLDVGEGIINFFNGGEKDAS